MDELLVKFGDPGRYQIGVYGMLWVAMSATACNNFIGIFVVGYYPHHCKIPDDWGWTENESIPLNSKGELDSCSMYKNPGNQSQGTTTCLFGWKHLTPGREWTVVQEWDLVCADHHLGALSNSLYYFGIMIGCAVFGFLSDKIGRRLVILGTLYCHIPIAVAISYASSYSMYVALRILHGCIMQGVSGTASILSVEIFQPNRRSTLAIINQVLWPIALCLVTGASYVLGTWRSLHLAGGLPAIITIVYIWFLPESVRWLLVFGKLPEAHTTLLKLARYNKLPVPPNLELEIQAVADEIAAMRTSKQKAEFMELFKGRKMQQIVLSTSYIWFATLVAYWGISYSMPKFGATTHINFITLGILEIVLVATLMYYIMARVGRRKVCMSILGTCATLNVLAAIFRSTFPRQYLWANILLGMVATTSRASLSLLFACMPMYCNELYPTNVRTLASGFSQIIGRIGNMVAPYVILLEHDVWTPLPFLIYVLFSVSMAILIFLLPETLNKPLPELTEDLVKLWKSKPAKPRASHDPVSDTAMKPLNELNDVEKDGGVLTPIITDAVDD